jgi:hypothetical protein
MTYSFKIILRVYHDQLVRYIKIIISTIIKIIFILLLLLLSQRKCFSYTCHKDIQWSGDIVPPILNIGTRQSGAHGGVVFKALRYKPGGRGFDSQWCHWNFSVT